MLQLGGRKQKLHKNTNKKLATTLKWHIYMPFIFAQFSHAIRKARIDTHSQENLGKNKENDVCRTQTFYEEKKISLVA